MPQPADRATPVRSLDGTATKHLGGKRSMSKISIALALVCVVTGSLVGCTDSAGAKGVGGHGGTAVGGRGGNSVADAAAAGGGGGNVGGTNGSAGSGGGDACAQVSVGSCGTNASSTSGVPLTTRLDALTPEQKAAICDWVAQLYGGYGAHLSCGGLDTLDAPTTQADCVSNMDATSCAATVADTEACEKDTSCDDPFPASCNPIIYDCN